MDEFDFISTYFAPLAGPEGLGLLDDAACFQPRPGYDLVITNDAMVEGVHFPKGAYGEDVARRLMRVNLSDLAAKGAQPLGYLLSLAWPKNHPVSMERRMMRFTRGLELEQQAHDFCIFGGDTVMTDGPMMVSATFIGQVPTGTMVKRSGAKPGDDVWVTGTLGGACLGLKSIENDALVQGISLRDQQVWREAYWEPEIRLSFGDVLKSAATASADISDGILSDAGHIAKASGVKIDINLTDLPFDAAAQTWLETQNEKAKIDLMTFGDDYEILFTAPPENRAKLNAAVAKLGFPVTRIGECSVGSGVDLRAEDGRKIHVVATGYAHF